MSDLIDRQAAIDAMANTLWHYPNDCYKNLNAYEFAKALAELGLRSLPSAQLLTRTEMSSADDIISRQAAIDALWKALYAYEEKTEKQFQESDELDVSDWIEHRAFVQNMSDIDRQTILALPSAQPEIIRCGGCKYWNEGDCNCPDINVKSQDYMIGDFKTEWDDFCSYAERRTDG